MKEKSVFSFSTYKAIMAHHLLGATHRGELTRAAKVLGCQRSYLSRVISESLHLTPDHAFNLANFFKINHSEREYFLNLVETADPHLRREEQIEWLKRLDAEHENLRAALTWAMSKSSAESALRLAGGLESVS